MKDIKLTDIIDVTVLQSIQDAFAKATGMAALTVDLEHDVTLLSNPTNFCIKLTRGSKEGYKRCNECDLKGGNEAACKKKPVVYYCHAGLVDFAAPILIGEKQIGALLGGQVLPEPPDEKKFRKIARELGVNEDEYIEALSHIKIVPKEQITAAANLLFEIAKALSEQGMQKLRLKDSVDNLIFAYQKLSEDIKKSQNAINTMLEISNALKSNFKTLVESSSKANSDAEKTTSVLKHVKDVSEQTRILGFNASIEAARSGSAGAGFSVIAQEVRRLADDSEKYTEGINTALSELKTSISLVNDNVDQIFKSIDESAKTAELLSSTVKSLENETQNFSALCETLKS